MTDTDNTVEQFKERVYNGAVNLYGERAKQYLEELGIVPTVRFEQRDGETLASLNAAVFAKLEELAHHGHISPAYVQQFADEVGLEQPGTREVTVRATFRLSPQEIEGLTETGNLPRRQPVRVSVESE